MRRGAAIAIGLSCAAIAWSRWSYASDIDANGNLVFASDAIAIYDFESASELTNANAASVQWSNSLLLPTTLKDTDWSRFAFADPRALHGGYSLQIAAGDTAIAYRDESLFASLGAKRFSISFWGRAEGAEPMLVVAYNHGGANLGPHYDANVIAIRTGRETSDGWSEFSTGAIDGSVWGLPIQAFLFTASFTTTAKVSTVPLIAEGMDPKAPFTLLDPKGVAWIDAVEVRPAAGSVASGTCTTATVDHDCGAGGDCVFGHCVDSAFVWGPMAPDAHKSDAVARWNFTASSLLADRNAVATNSPAFAQAAPSIATATTPRAFFGALREQVNSLRDAHTDPGSVILDATTFAPEVSRYSGGLDACFGVVQNDLPSGDTSLHYAVFAVGGNGAIAESVAVGDLLASIDGEDPDTWLAPAMASFAYGLPNDSASDPVDRAQSIAWLVSHHASTIAMRHCTSAGCAAPVTIPIGQEIYAPFASKGTIKGSSIECTPRFTASVASAVASTTDKVFVATQNGITNVQFDGFSPNTATLAPDWQTPFTQALAQPLVLIDARIGNGGQFSDGKWLIDQIRGADQPFAWIALPRADIDSIDATWLVGPGWGNCLISANSNSNACDWGGGQYATTSMAASSSARIAWVNSRDVSMNDIVPRSLQGMKNFRIFGPVASFGAYGEISRLMPMGGNWTTGSIQVLDSRFGTTFDDAATSAWASGKGVAPDQVVVQKLSDLLAGQDTLLNAARTWLNQ